MLDLEAIKARRNTLGANRTLASWQDDIDALLLEVERLQLVLKAKDDFTDQVDQYTKRIELKVDGLDTNINDLLKVIERLSGIIKAKDAVLAQFSDKENWEFIDAMDHAYQHYTAYQWDQPSNPIDLANQALNEGHE